MYAYIMCMSHSTCSLHFSFWLYYNQRCHFYIFRFGMWIKNLWKCWFLHISFNSILQVPLCFLIKYLYTTSPFQLGRHVFIKNKSTFLMFRYVALFSKDCIWYFIITRLFWHLQIAEPSNSGIKKSKKPPHLHFTFAL